MLYLLKVRK